VRPHRELWFWLGGLFLALAAFLAAIAIAYFTKVAHYSLFLNWWMLFAWISFVAAFTCFFGAIQAWPFPPPAKPEFPDIEVEIYATGAVACEREADTGLAVPAHLRSFNLRFASTEAGRSASLSAALYIKLVPGSWGRVGEALCPPPSWALPPSLSLNPISMPFVLAPGDAIAGQLVYEIPEYYLDKVAEPLNARLELWDHVTDMRMNVRAEIGSYDKGEMVPSSGSAEILGPEYESQPDQPGGGRLASPLGRIHQDPRDTPE
jgi:hypothetical protein